MDGERLVLYMLSALVFIFTLLTGKTYAKGQDIIVNLKDFGVDKSGNKDSSKAFIKALAYIKNLAGKNKRIKLYMEKGIYRISKESCLSRLVHTSNTDSIDYPIKKIGILIEKISNLEIEGNDSLLIFEGDMMGLGIFQSKNITINNLSWDYQVPSTSEMTVFAFDERQHWVDYYIANHQDYEIRGKSIIWKSEKDSQGNYYWTEKNSHRNYGIPVKYPQYEMVRNYYSEQDPFIGLKNIEKLDDDLIRFHYENKPVLEPKLGMTYQFVSNSVRPTAGALVWESKNISFNNIHISYMHGFGFLIQMSENVFFDKITIATDVKTGKYTSSYADGIHVSGARGKIEIKNSFFSNTHDDPINIHGTFTKIEKILGKNKLKLVYIHKQQAGFQQYYPGDKLVICSRDGIDLSIGEREYTVKKVEGPSTNDLKSMLVELEEDLPAYLAEEKFLKFEYLCENISYNPEILIKNNCFINVFTRMILAQSRNKIVIEDNDFDCPSMSALFFSRDTDEWYESGSIRDLIIRNNNFRVRSIGRTWWKYSPAIYFHPVTKSDILPGSENPIYKNILIENNSFYLESDGVLRAESVENFRFINNRILRLNPKPILSISAKTHIRVSETCKIHLLKRANKILEATNLPKGPEKNSGSSSNILEFRASKNVIISGNYYDYGLKNNVLLEDMAEENIKLFDDLSISNTRLKKIMSNNVFGDIFFVSSNPDHVSVDNEGKVLGLSEGSSEIYAYTILNESLVKSNPIEISVIKSDNKSSSKNFIELEGDFINKIPISDNMIFDIPKDIQKVEVIKNFTRKIVDISNINSLTVKAKNIIIRRYEDSSVDFECIKTSLGDLDLNKDNIFIRTNRPDRNIKIKVLAKKSSSIIVFSREDNRNYPCIDSEFVVPIYNGLNSIKIRAFSDDETIYKDKTIHILRNHKILYGVKEIMLGEKPIKSMGKIIDFENRYRLDDLKILPRDRNASLEIFDFKDLNYKKKDSEKSGFSKNVLVRIEHESMLDIEFHEFTLINIK